MALDLLEELETSASAAVNLEEIEELLRATRRAVAPVVSRIAESLKGSALTYQNAWQRIVLDVAKGKTAEIQSARPRLIGALEKQLRRLKLIHSIAASFKAFGEPNVPNPDDLLPEIAGMERLKITVFDQWTTAEELEALAARDYPLTGPDLERIGPQRRPPEAWYKEEWQPSQLTLIVPRQVVGLRASDLHHR